MPPSFDVFPLAAGWQGRAEGVRREPRRTRRGGKVASGGLRRAGTTRSAATPWPIWGYAPGGEERHQGTQFVQTEPNGLIYMRGRFYSPAWHCFLNPDQGADPSQLNQYAYAGGNPMVNVDPSGMSWFSNLLHHAGHALSVDWNHMRHQADVNWDHGREELEIGAAVIACAVIDIATCGTGTFLDDFFVDSAFDLGSDETALAATACIGAGTGGAFNGWKGALDGAFFPLQYGQGVKHLVILIMLKV